MGGRNKGRKVQTMVSAEREVLRERAKQIIEHELDTRLVKQRVLAWVLEKPELFVEFRLWFSNLCAQVDADNS